VQNGLILGAAVFEPLASKVGRGWSQAPSSTLALSMVSYNSRAMALPVKVCKNERGGFLLGVVYREDGGWRGGSARSGRVRLRAACP
jgi:hypothetical protein